MKRDDTGDTLDSFPATVPAPDRWPLVIDDSLSLINRTGAHWVACDLVEAFGSRATVRRWRRWGHALPSPTARKLLGRAMLAEMRALGAAPFARWPRPRGAKTLFLDPLYVLRAPLAPSDIVLCHDIGPISLPSIYPEPTVALYRAAYARIEAERPGMVFVSEASRRAFVAEFGDDFRFLEAIPLYVRAAAALGEESPVEGVEPPFLLSVGALEQRKNHRGCILAYARSGLAERGVGLVICGARGDAAAEIAELAAATPGVRLLGYVGDDGLRWLYRHALAFVLVSLLEGFGLPALEAARHGLIPLISSDSALAEAVAGLGVTVPARDGERIAEAMVRLVDTPAADRQAWGRLLRAAAAAATRERFLHRWQRLLGHELMLAPAVARSPAVA